MDSEYRAKISDFSVQCHLPYKVGSTSLISASDVSALVGTRGYLPPEHGDGQQGPETDVYSYGIVCWFLLHTCIYYDWNFVTIRAHNNIIIDLFGNIYRTFGVLYNKR